MSSGGMSTCWPEIEAGLASCAPSSERAVASSSTGASPSLRKVKSASLQSRGPATAGRRPQAGLVNPPQPAHEPERGGRHRPRAEPRRASQCSRSSATASADRCGAGSTSPNSSKTSPRRSMRPAIAGAVSTSDGRVTSTRWPAAVRARARLPDRGLPDAGGPLEDQRRRRRPVEEPTDGLHLGLATKDVRDGHSFGQAMGSRGSTCIADHITHRNDCMPSSGQGAT